MVLEQETVGNEFAGEKKMEAESATDIVQTKPKKKNGKKLLLCAVGMVIVFILIAVGALVFTVDIFGFRNVGYLRNTEWGMTMAEVESLEETEPLTEGVETDSDKLYYLVSDIVGLEGKESTVLYKFTSDSLVGATVSLTGESINSESFEEALVKTYEELYGDAVSTGYSYEWTAKESTIKIIFVTEEWVVIVYEALA